MNKKKAPPQQGKALMIKVRADESAFCRQLLELETRLLERTAQSRQQACPNIRLRALNRFIDVRLNDDVPAAVTDRAHIVFKACRPVLDLEGIVSAIGAKNSE